MQNPLEYTAADGANDLNVAAKIYNVTDGTAVIDSTVSMAHVLNGTYWANFSADDAKDYLVNIQPYTDGTFATANSIYSSASLVIKARPVIFKKNTAYTAFMFPMQDSSGDPATGLTVTAERSIDGASFASCSNSVSEVGNGIYKLNLSAADLNGSGIMLKFTATGARTNFVSIFTAN